MDGDNILNINRQMYYNYGSIAINDDHFFESKMRREVNLNMRSMTIRQQPMQSISYTELSTRSTQTVTAQNQSCSEYDGSENILKSIGMANSKERNQKMSVEKILDYVLNHCIDAATIAEVFIEKINSKKNKTSKLRIRHAISRCLIEMVKRKRSKLAADILSEIAKQKYDDIVQSVVADIFAQTGMDTLFEIIGEIDEKFRHKQTVCMLRSMVMSASVSRKRKESGRNAAMFIIQAFKNGCINISTVSKLFVDKIKSAKSYLVKARTRHTISHCINEMAKIEGSALAANVLRKISEQENIEEVTRILVCIENNTKSFYTDNGQNVTKNILSNFEPEMIQEINCCIQTINGSRKHGLTVKRLKNRLGLVVKEQKEREQAFILATAQDAIEMLMEGEKNYEDVVDYLLCIACDGGYITGDEEVAAAQEILDAMAYNEPTKNKAVKVLRKMEDILLETANGDEHGFVANILQQLANKFPEE